jgi:hypothetical protein
MFLATLCLALHKTRREMLVGMDSEEFSWWQAIDRMSPVIAMAIYGAKLAGKIWKYRGSQKEQTPEEVDAAIDSYFQPLVQQCQVQK